MLNVFISYNRVSEDIVKQLAADLESLGHDVWFDQDLSGGQAWWDKILETVRACDVFVFALSTESLESTACGREYQYAAELGKPILPVMVADGVSPSLLPPALAAIQIVEYRDLEDRSAAFRLARAMGSLPPPGPLPDPLPPPPEVPISYLGSLTERLTAATLTLPEQGALIFELKHALSEPETRADALKLLERLKRRRDLYQQSAEDIDALLEDGDSGKGPLPPGGGSGRGGRPEPPPPPRPPFERRNLMIGGAALLILAFVVYLAWPRPGEVPPPGGDTSTQAEEGTTGGEPVNPTSQPAPGADGPVLTYDGRSLVAPLPLGSVELVGTVTADSDVEVTVNGDPATVSDGTWRHQLDVTFELGEIRIEATDEDGNEAAPLVFDVQPEPSRFLASLPADTVGALWVASWTRSFDDISRSPFDPFFFDAWTSLSSEWDAAMLRMGGRGGTPTLRQLSDDLQGEVLVSLHGFSELSGAPNILIQAHLAENADDFERKLIALADALNSGSEMAVTRGSWPTGTLFVFESASEDFTIVVSGPNVFASTGRTLAQAAAGALGGAPSDASFGALRNGLLTQRLAGSSAALLIDVDRSFDELAEVSGENVAPFARLLGARNSVADLGISWHRNGLFFELGVQRGTGSGGLVSWLRAEPFSSRVLLDVPGQMDYYLAVRGDLAGGIRGFAEFFEQAERDPGSSRATLQDMAGPNHDSTILLRALGDRAHIFGEARAGTSSGPTVGTTVSLTNPGPIRSWLAEQLPSTHIDQPTASGSENAWDVPGDRAIVGYDYMVREVAGALESGRAINRPELDEVPDQVNAVGYANPAFLAVLLSEMELDELSGFTTAVVYARWVGDRFVITLDLHWD